MRALILLCVPVLAGCTGFNPSKLTGNWSPQEYAGCTMVEYHQPDGGRVNWRDCKDKSAVGATMSMQDGTNFTYNANEVTGLAQMQERAEVERALNAAGVTVTGDVIDQIIRALRPAQ